MGEEIGDGRVAAIFLAGDGCSVVSVDLNRAWVEKTVAAIAAKGPGIAVSCVADVSVPE